jgi:endonuclease-3
VCDRLEEEYGNPRHGNPERPVDDLIYILLSNRTTPHLAQRVYTELQSVFETWTEVASANRERVYDIVQKAGFGQKRTDYIRGCISRIEEDFGNVDATELWSADTEEILDYLVELPGVSDKVARCVAMYALDRSVLPVDVHVHRVAFRLGWVDRSRPDICHEELEELLPPHRYYAFHVNCVAHGRDRCTARSPTCDGCPIRRRCNFTAGD